MFKYDHVNALWPTACPIPTAPEALRGARLLVRHAYRLARQDITGFRRKPQPGKKYALTSGNRYTYPRSGVWYVNPKGHYYGGWKDMVHDISHWAHRAFWPNVKHGHSLRHIWIEQELTKYVVESSWLTGALAKPEPQKPPRNVKAERAQRIFARLVTWEAKRKRADTMIRKLRKQSRYYERALA